MLKLLKLRDIEIKQAKEFPREFPREFPLICRTAKKTNFRSIAFCKNRNLYLFTYSPTFPKVESTFTDNVISSKNSEFAQEYQSYNKEV